MPSIPRPTTYAHVRTHILGLPEERHLGLEDVLLREVLRLAEQEVEGPVGLHQKVRVAEGRDLVHQVVLRHGLLLHGGRCRAGGGGG
jgi:hypothetical protein